MPQPGVFAPPSLVEPYVPLGEPVTPASAGPLSLDQVLVFADAHAPIIATARARADEARADTVEAQIALPDNPYLTIEGGGRRVGEQSGFDFEVAIEQQFEVAGERGLRIEAAERDERSAQSGVNEVRWAVHAESHRLFVALLLAAERKRLAQHFVDFSESLHAVSTRKVEAGEDSPLVLLVSEADLAQTRAALVEARRHENNLQTRLAALIGWPAETLPQLVGALPPIRSAPAMPELFDRMAQHHPSLRTRELALAAQQAHLALAQREKWPKLTVGASFGQESSPEGAEGASIALLSIGVPLPLWRSNEVGVSRARAALIASDREREETVSRLRSEVLQAAAALDASAERVALYETTIVPRFEENLALLGRAFELGEIGIHEVSQTRSRLLAATAGYLAARTQYYETAATLEGLIGTELWPEEAQP